MIRQDPSRESNRGEMQRFQESYNVTSDQSGVGIQNPIAVFGPFNTDAE
jgi:hypothetical protein